MPRKRKKGSKNIIVTILSLLIGIIILTTSSYAWFRANSDIENTGLTVKISSTRSMQTSADAITWKAGLTLLDVLDAKYLDITNRYNQLPINFKPASTIGNLDSTGKLDMFIGNVISDKDPDSATYKQKILTAYKVEDGDGQVGAYLAFDLYFRNYENTTVYLGKDSYITYDGDVSIGVENAMRVAIVNEGTVADMTDIEAIQNLKTTDNSHVIIWEPNMDGHSATGIEAALNLYHVSVANGDNKSVPYVGIKSPINTGIPITSGDTKYFDTVEPQIKTNIKQAQDKNIHARLFDVPKGITKVRIYAWVEGQDVDCENNAAGSSFILNLNFTNK